MKHARGGLYAVFLIGAMSLGACAEIPQEAVTTSTAVSKGIEGMQANMEVLINDRAAVQLKAYDEAYDAMFAKVQSAYVANRAKAKNVPAASYTLTAAEQADLTAYYIINVDQKIRTEIEKQRAALLAKTRSDASLVVGLNDSVTALLTSAAKVQAERTAATQKVASVTKIDAIGKIEGFLNGTVTDVLSKLGQ